MHVLYFRSTTNVKSVEKENVNPVIEIKSSPSLSPATPDHQSVPKAAHKPSTSAKRKLNINKTLNQSIDNEIKKIDNALAKQEEHDEAFYIGMSIAAKIRKYDEYQLALFRREIENVMFNIQFNNGNSHTNMFNHGNSNTNLHFNNGNSHTDMQFNNGNSNNVYY